MSNPCRPITTTGVVRTRKHCQTSCVRIDDVGPGDQHQGPALLRLQRAAYAVEAALIADDRIPGLHESLKDLRTASLRWLGAFEDTLLVGAVAWSETADDIDIDRLVVDPPWHRRGVGRALVQAVLSRAGVRRVTVSTGRNNRAARELYADLGFIEVGDIEVIPRLWITRYSYIPSAL